MGRLCRGAGLRINMKQLKERSFYLHNFGCKVNQEEGAALAALFLAPDRGDPDPTCPDVARFYGAGGRRKWVG